MSDKNFYWDPSPDMNSLKAEFEVRTSTGQLAGTVVCYDTTESKKNRTWTAWTNKGELCGSFDDILAARRMLLSVFDPYERFNDSLKRAVEMFLRNLDPKIKSQISRAVNQSWTTFCHFMENPNEELEKCLRNYRVLTDNEDGYTIPKETFAKAAEEVHRQFRGYE